MRVLTFTTLFPNESYPRRGLFVRARVAHVAQHCEVEVVAPVPRAPSLPGMARARLLASVPEREELDGLAVHHPRYLSLPGEWPRLKPRAIAAAGWRVVRALHAERPFDLVDAHFAHPDAAAAAILARRLGLPLVVSVRGSDIHRDLARPRLRPLILATMEQAAAVVAVAQPLADALRAAGIDPARLFVIENGVDHHLFGRHTHEDARRELGLEPDGILVLSVGNLVPVKGHAVLLDAFASLPHPGQLWIAGHGPLRRALEARAAALGLADRVRFLGSVDQDRLALLYAAADVFALSSLNEGCPNVVLEALAAGCPVAATSVGHVPHLVQEGRNGALATPGDARALAAALRRVLTSLHDRAAVRATLAERTWDRVAGRVLDVFGRSLNGGAANVDMKIPQCG